MAEGRSEIAVDRESCMNKLILWISNKLRIAMLLV